jgi:SAM-dependent methyltransferase
MDDNARSHYELGLEQARLAAGTGLLEFARTQEILRRRLPSAPATVLDVGGGPGTHARWLAADGYRVHLVDALDLHVRQALAAAAAQPDHPFTASVGDARALAAADRSADVVLLLGPLYHLLSREDRIGALGEALRVVRPEGLVVAAAISRYASLLDSLTRGFLPDPEFLPIVLRDLEDGEHRNPGGRPQWFTTAFFHHPEELAQEVVDAGLELVELIGVEGPGWLLPDIGDRWADEVWRELLLFAARAVETEVTMRSVSAHLLAVARRPSEPSTG